ncbi:NAD(P)/FAD-dependent oxidoreductase [Chelativorans salis]|uniref:NAD(P)/FAD-dependent oxidoreductase n=1 Tax=Chelativorans salis TaxID=2978478 RepID=A0ABT2LI00_9HYPH|nr:NAD(P)/FAD-dependent oxidoreductase [Chelativorans sp. EGI FJ00035]MCT7374093.1 NAD(P)/FAD-dependent oxidoreductase [Chelativorans sp. EGI FJ00035]
MQQPQRIVIVGAGFAGLEVAKALGKAGIDVTIIDRHNHHLFQPLLYQVATAALSAPDIAEPIRRIVRRYPSTKVLFGEVAGIDRDGRRVLLSDGEAIRYDVLILATGSVPGYFGRDDWAAVSPGLKTIEDARKIRSELLLAFEIAERATDPVTQERLMTIAIIGGGPTGVELAGSIAELSRYTLARDFRNIRPESARIILVEAGPRLLPAFSEKLSEYAAERLQRLGVKILTNKAVDHLSDGELGIAGERIGVGLVLWAAGVAASPLAREVGVETDWLGRLIVDDTLRVRGEENIFALGDVAHFADADGRPLPGLAQVAKQQGMHLGHSLARHLTHGDALVPFTYRSRGNTAIIGRHAAVFEQGRFKVKGWIAWLAWAIIHIYLLIGFQSRVLVSVQWLWRYATYDRGARLIARETTPKARPGPKAASRKRKRHEKT